MKLSLIAAMLCFTSIALASPPDGSLVASRQLDPNQGVLYHVKLKGGETTTIDAHGTKADGDVDCQLLKGIDIVANDSRPGVNACSMQYVPKTTGEYVLVILNRGKVTDTFTCTVQ